VAQSFARMAVPELEGDGHTEELTWDESVKKEDAKEQKEVNAVYFGVR